jgi:hypothetical protein
MPLRDGYGVLVGTLHNYFCDRKTSDSNYYHCNIKVRSRSKLYLCPVDLDSKHDANGFQWRVVHIAQPELGPVKGFLEGWHHLESRKGSGALDYYRSEALQPTGECLCQGNEPMLPEPAGEGLRSIPVWKSGTGIEAFADLEPLLSGSIRLFVYGEPFRVGRGVHNIHQNQGDPDWSRWQGENGIWQDGGVAVLLKDGTVSAFLCKFKTQTFFPSAPKVFSRSD